MIPCLSPLMNKNIHRAGHSDLEFKILKSFFIYAEFIRCNFNISCVYKKSKGFNKKQEVVLLYVITTSCLYSLISTSGVVLLYAKCFLS